MSKSIALLFLILFEVTHTAAQTKLRLRTAQLYEPGEKIVIPRYGFYATTPNTWEGTLPRENEVLILSSTQDIHGEIIVFARDNAAIQSMYHQWSGGFNLSEAVHIKAKDPPAIEEDLLVAEVLVEGGHLIKSNKAFAVARCSPYGPCIISLMTASYSNYKDAMSAVRSFMTQATFREPSDESPYANLEWREFLSGKVLMSLSSMEDDVKESKIHFCGNGKFLVEFRNERLIANQDPAFKGRMGGTWSTEDTGEGGVIHLKFKKRLRPIQLTFNIREERVYVGGERHFLGLSDWCK